MEKVVVAIYEGIYSNILLEALLKNPNCTVTKIIKSDRLVGTKSVPASLMFFLRKTSLLFLVPKMFEVFLYYFGVLCVAKNKRAYKTLKEISKDHHIPIDSAVDINQYLSEEEGTLEKVLFSISYYQKFNAATLTRFKKAYNIHPAPLPEGAGLFPSFWLLLYPSSKSDRYFQTVHQMTTEIDRGPIVDQRSVEKPPHIRSSAHYMTEATKLGAQMLETFDFNWPPQEKGKNGTYYAYPKTKDVCAFFKKGNTFFRMRDVKSLLYKGST